MDTKSIIDLSLWLFIVGLGLCMITIVLHHVYLILMNIYQNYKEVINPPDELKEVERGSNYEIVRNYFYNKRNTMEDSNNTQNNKTE